MNLLFVPLVLPIVIGLLQTVIPGRFKTLHRGILTFAALANFLVTLYLFLFQPRSAAVYWRFDNFCAFIMLGIGFFGALISLYSLKFFSEEFNFKEFSIYSLWSLGAAAGVSLANDFIFFTVFWGFIGLTLYLLVNLLPRASSSAKKMFVLVGGTDVLLILGIALISFQRGNWSISGATLPMNAFSITAFLCLALAAFAKVGVVPVHTWVPDVTENAAVPVTALLPASLDKLLGIYFLVRIITVIFVPSAFITDFLMIVGALTIIVGVMMILVQNNIKRFLGYNTISQVGYMIVGIGTGNLLGVVGGLFHMLNHTLYESALFLSAGSIEKKTGTSDLRDLGGLARVLPLTFATTIVASMAISGIPPLNGFVSKWLIYQGLIQEFNLTHSVIALIALLAALFGSAVTLAGVMKLLSAAFLTSPKKPLEGIKEVSWLLWLPMLILAFLCVVFGIFVFQIPIPHLIANSIAFNVAPYLGSIGFWQPGLATALILAGLAAGFIVYLFFIRTHAVRRDTAFVGGEKIPAETYPSGTDFYKTISNIGLFKALYEAAQKKLFDLYDLSASALSAAGRYLSGLHNGILSEYLAWCIIGFIIVFLFLL